MNATSTSDPVASRAAACRAGSWACLCVLLGALLSGPGAMLLVQATHPQPAWKDAISFCERFHPVQSTPYFLGLFLIGGSVVLISSLHALAPLLHKPRTGSALVFSGVAGALVFQNYVLQTTFVPHLARRCASQDYELIAASSMANPSSLAWALEMWGYGFLGIATWLSAPVFSEPGLQRATRWLFVANGLLSVVGALGTAARPGWVMAPLGFAMFALWNLLFIAMLGLAFVALRREAQAQRMLHSRTAG